MDVGNSRVELMREADQIIDWRLARGESNVVYQAAFERMKARNPRAVAQLILYTELEFGEDPPERQRYLDNRMREIATQHTAEDLALFTGELLDIARKDLKKVA